ncbi:MAG: hypothetical protein JNN07_14490, partial [Verrucomicrobiales bacterium]|nr:hypothetical protein [Verrucomicrobiales bacterium]
MKSKFHSLFCAFSFITVAGTGIVSADVITWNNAGGGEWDVPTNWSPQQVPGANDRVVVDGTASFTIQMAGSQSVSELVMDNPNATLRMVANSTVGHGMLTVANPFENHGTIELTSVDGEAWGAFLTVTTGTLLNAADGVLRVLQGT